MEGMLGGAQDALDKSRAHCAHAPDVAALAGVFSQGGDPLDADLPAERVLGLLGAVPLAPVAAIKASMSGASKQKSNFQAFAEHVYGTPTICGWWPSYMEET